MNKYRNNKNGNIYTIFSNTFINTTNGPGNGQIMVGYFNSDGQLFVRENNEFYQKFTKIEE
jgi:hypothetical protein